MDPFYVLFLAFLIGVISGLRSMTAPAAVTWAVHRGWPNLHSASLSLLGSTTAVIVFTLGAIVELIGDKLPSTPSRLKPPGLIARIVLGGLSGAAIAVAGGQSIAAGAVLGAAGGVAGAFGGFQARTKLVKILKVPDLPIALLEDVVAVAGALFVVSRF